MKGQRSNCSFYRRNVFINNLSEKVSYFRAHHLIFDYNYRLTFCDWSSFENEILSIMSIRFDDWNA
jgi:hypothetical protein